jgi:hypothetical protein
VNPLGWASPAGDRAVTKNGYTKQDIETIRNDVEVTSIGVWLTDQGIYPVPWQFGYGFRC